MTISKSRKPDPVIAERNENIYRFMIRHGRSASTVKIAAVEFDVSEANIRMIYNTKVKQIKQKLNNEIMLLDLRGFTKEGIALNLKISHKEVNDALRKVKSNKAKIPESLMLWVQ